MRKIGFILALSISSLLFSCGSLRNKNELGKEVVDSSEGSLSYGEIQERLTKSVSFGNGLYQLKVLPLTEAYVEAKVAEQVELEGINDVVAKQMLIDQKKKYVFDSFCAKVQAKIVRHQEVLDIRSWQVAVFDGTQTLHEMEWIEPVNWQLPVRSEVETDYGKEGQWIIDGVACSKGKVTVLPDIRLVVRPPFVPWPFPAQTETKWVFESLD